MCRWASADPAGLADGLNCYLYARGSPIRLMDGSGLEGEESQGAGNYQCTVEGMQNPVESNVGAMAQFSKEDWEAIIAADMAPNSPQMFETGSEQHLNYQEKVNQPMQEQFLKDEALRSMYRSSAGGLGGSMGKIAGDGLSAVQNAQDGVVGQTLEQLQVTATLANVGALADAGAVGQFLSPKKKAQTSKKKDGGPVPEASAFVGVGGKGGNASKGVASLVNSRDVARIGEIRTSLIVSKKRNIAFGEGHIDGKDFGEVLGVSGQNTPGSMLRGDRVFETGIVGHDRALDAEVFVLESYARRLTPSSRGTLNLVSERALCESCGGVVSQFQVMFPNVNLVIRAGTGG